MGLISSVWEFFFNLRFLILYMFLSASFYIHVYKKLAAYSYCKQKIFIFTLPSLVHLLNIPCHNRTWNFYHHRIFCIENNIVFHVMFCKSCMVALDCINWFYAENKHTKCLAWAKANNSCSILVSCIGTGRDIYPSPLRKTFIAGIL